jgi:hypothetical protein
MLTPEQVNAIVESRLARAQKAWEAASVSQGGAQAPTEPAPQEPASPSGSKQDGTLRDRLRTLELNASFSDAALDLGVPRESLGIIRDMFGDREAGEVREFVESQWKRLQSLGVGKSKETEVKEPTNGKGDLPPTPVNGATAPAAPSGVPDAERYAEPLKWTADDIAYLKGNGTFLTKVNEWASRLPGGGSGLFRKSKPGGSNG